MIFRKPVLLSILLTTLIFKLQLIPAVGYAEPPAANTSTNATDNFIRTSCNITLYPEVCYTSLSPYADAIQQDPAQLTRVSIAVSLSKARRIATYMSNVSRQADYVSDPQAVSALHDCYSNFKDAVDEIHDSLEQMRQLGTGERLRFQMSNVQTWMSAALTDQDTCTDGFEEVGDGTLKKDVCDMVAKVRKYTSNALALVNSYAGKETS